MKNRHWILIFLIAGALCASALLLHRPCGAVVTISQDGVTLYTIDLSQVDEPYTLTIPYGAHYNQVEITNQSVWVSEADCGNQVCVRHGPLEENGTPITCLPHHLIIAWAESRVDG